jgi:DNA polymerase III epsilon subunit-like protein
MNKIHIAVDLETTGLIAGTHEILEIGILQYDPVTLMPTGHSFSSMVKPTRPWVISDEAMKINGIDIKNINSCLSAPAVKLRLLDWKEAMFGEDSVFFPLNHAYDFDKGFLKYFLGDRDYDIHFSRDFICTKTFLNSIRDHYDFTGLESTSLKNICKYLGIKRESEHRALSDARAALEVYGALLRKLTS